MTQKLDLKIQGLYTNPNEFSEVPEGALTVADNIVIDRESVAESRRGQKQYGSALNVDIAGRINKLFSYKNTLISHYDDKLAYDSNNAGTWTEYSSTYDAPADDVRVQAAQANRNFYFTTSAGIFKLDAINATPRQSGAPKGLDGTATVTGSSGFMATNTAIAYRIIWGYRDRNNNLILGAPSQRVVVNNTSGGTRDISLTFTIPSDVTTNYIYQIYRSGESASATSEPNDELQLVLEDNPTSAQVTALEFTVTDNTPDDLKGAFLYTSPSQQGIGQANEPPPYAKHLEVFKDHMMYSNCISKQRYTFNLLAVSNPSFGFDVDAGVSTTNASAVLTSITDTSVLRVGMRVVGTGIPADTYILSIDSATQVTMTNNATVTNTGVSIEFQDRLSIGTSDYFGGSSTDQATNQFEVSVGGTPGENIDNTALEFIEVVNKDPSNTTNYAYYLSGYTDLPGQILIEERTLGSDPFIVTTTDPQSFQAVLSERKTITNISIADPTVITCVDHGLTSGDSITIFNASSVPDINGVWVVTVLDADTFSIPVAVTTGGSTGYFALTDGITISDNDERINRIYISKTRQPEAVPILQYKDIGSADAPILRTIALRDSMFVFKADGIFRITGEDVGTFRVNLFDNTTVLKVPESARSFNNQVFCFSDQGIISVSDNGVQVISRPIESTLLELSSDLYPNFDEVSFGISYESNRQYIFFTVSNRADTYATQAFVYNSITNTWTRWILSRTCAIVNPRDNKIYSGHPTNDFVYQERKDYALTDYADEEVAVTVVGSTAEVVEVTDTTDLLAGMTLKQSTRESVIVSVDDSTHITVSNILTWVAGDADAFTPIPTSLTFAKMDVENPGIVKQFREITLIFRDATFNTIDVGFNTNFAATNSWVTLRPQGSNQWGNFPWGEGLWGGGLGGSQPLRTFVPLEKQRAHWMTLTIDGNQAFTTFGLAGVSLFINGVSERFGGNGSAS